jgi:hypothetical protein
MISIGEKVLFSLALMLIRLQTKGTKIESERMQFYAQRYLTQIVDLMESVPSDLLLLLKTNDCLRQLDKSVGRPVNTLTGRYFYFYQLRWMM